MRTLNILKYTFTLAGAFAFYGSTTKESCGTRLASCFFGPGFVKTGWLIHSVVGRFNCILNWRTGSPSLPTEQNTPRERWLANTRFGVKPAGWAGNYRDEMERLYTAIFPIKLRLERVPRLNPGTGIHMQECWLILELPGQSALGPETIYFSGDELRNGLGYRSLAWVEQQLRSVFYSEEREQILQPKRTPVTWPGSDFTRDEGARVHNAASTATYRKVYHDDDQIFGLQGELTYRPQPGL